LENAENYHSHYTSSVNTKPEIGTTPIFVHAHSQVDL